MQRRSLYRHTSLSFLSSGNILGRLRLHIPIFDRTKALQDLFIFIFLIAVICCAGMERTTDQPASVTRGSKSYCLNQTLGCWQPSRRPGRIAEEEVCSVRRNKVLIIWAAGTTVCVCNEC